MANLDKYNTMNPVKQYLIKGYKERLYEFVESEKPKQVLDLGCGEGIIIKYLKSKNSNYEFRGIDFSKEAINKAKRLNPYASFLVRDLYNLDESIIKKNYDIVLWLEVMEHLEHPEKVLREINKLKFEKLIISVPWEPIFRLVVLLGNFYSWDKIKNLGRNKNHVQHFNKQKLKNLLKKFFKIQEMVYQFPWIFVVARPR